MPTLLISLGTSPAIVPEAFLLPGVQFEAVHVLTTDSTKVDFVLDWFHDHAPDVLLSITRVADFTDFKSEQDHFRFEEVLYRWWLEKTTDNPQPYVCLSGGFKTMSAAMQKAAAVLGATEVFHVLADSVYQDPNIPTRKLPASTAQQIEDSRIQDHLHWIKLGQESGWPQLRTVSTVSFPLHIVRSDGVVRWAESPDQAFRNHIQNIVQRSHHIAGSWDSIGSLPFPILATWSTSTLEWLQQPLDPQNDREWIASLPKIELHCHLGGFATHGDLLHQVRAAAEFPDKLPPLALPTPPSDWPLPTQPITLDRYMSLGNANGSKLLKDPGCLRRQCQLLYQHLQAQKIVYAEIRCSPNNYTAPDRSAWQVVTDIRNTFQECMEQHPDGCHVNLIIIATRKNDGDRSDISRHLSLAVTAADHWHKDCRIVGVDLAGFEHRETRAALFATDFEQIHRVGLAVTVHAGENDDAEGIWQAVFKLNTRRLGHALHLIDAPDLLRAVADRRIGVEMCPYANYQIKGFDPMLDKPPYPLTQYLRKGVPVTINTDNIGISAASLTDNFLLAATLCPDLTRMNVLRILSNSLEIAFLSPELRTKLRTSVELHLATP